MNVVEVRRIAAVAVFSCMLAGSLAAVGGNWRVTRGRHTSFYELLAILAR